MFSWSKNAQQNIQTHKKNFRKFSFCISIIKLLLQVFWTATATFLFFLFFFLKDFLPHLIVFSPFFSPEKCDNSKHTKFFSFFFFSFSPHCERQRSHPFTSFLSSLHVFGTRKVKPVALVDRKVSGGGTFTTTPLMRGDSSVHSAGRPGATKRRSAGREGE